MLRLKIPLRSFIVRERSFINVWYGDSSVKKAHRWSIGLFAGKLFLRSTKHRVSRTGAISMLSYVITCCRKKVLPER